MRNQDNGWSSSIPPRRGYDTVDPAIYASPDTISADDNGAKGWCLNPACDQKLNSYNVKPPFLCHRCQNKWRDGDLILSVNGHGVIGYPGFGARVRFPNLKTLVGIRGNKLVAISS